MTVGVPITERQLRLNPPPSSPSRFRRHKAHRFRRIFPDFRFSCPNTANLGLGQAEEYPLSPIIPALAQTSYNKPCRTSGDGGLDESAQLSEDVLKSFGLGV